MDSRPVPSFRENDSSSNPASKQTGKQRQRGENITSAADVILLLSSQTASYTAILQPLGLCAKITIGESIKQDVFTYVCVNVCVVRENRPENLRTLMLKYSRAYIYVRIVND